MIDKSPDRIASMFDAIAGRYDFLNHFLSAGRDKRWRARAIRELALQPDARIVDLCTGTGDFAIAAADALPRAEIVGVDFAGAMLGLGLKKIRRAGEDRRITLVRGDALKLPVADGSADAVTIGFGVRNVQKPEVACAEMARVLRRGGRLAILEFGMPGVPGVRALYEWYFSRVLPFIGQRVSGHGGAYAYLPASVGSFPPPAEFVTVLRQAGFADVRAVPLTFGIVYLYTAVRR
jgi:demethylmenaquinone methyltransferase/2-methoxy-6-polyprenyl-1,4-benzoquinol methylase